MFFFVMVLVTGGVRSVQGGRQVTNILLVIGMTGVKYPQTGDTSTAYTPFILEIMGSPLDTNQQLHLPAHFTFHPLAIL